MAVADAICADIQRRLEGSGLAFALVLWVPGQADRVESVSLSAHPIHTDEATTALRCVADQVDAIARRDAR
jgi:hypothetical protein